jgi:hypothetical protein
MLVLSSVKHTKLASLTTGGKTYACRAWRAASRFSELLVSKAIPTRQHWAYRKWLRFYLDFCKKYASEVKDTVRLELFIKKLKANVSQLSNSSRQCRQYVCFIKLTMRCCLKQVWGQHNLKGRIASPVAAKY